MIMDILGELFVEIIFRRIIAGIFGYYTLFILYKVFNNKDGLEWLSKSSKHEGDEFGKGCLINIVGLLSFSVITILITSLIFYLIEFF